jgi:hypothetical protein
LLPRCSSEFIPPVTTCAIADIQIVTQYFEEIYDTLALLGYPLPRLKQQHVITSATMWPPIKDTELGDPPDSGPMEKSDFYPQFMRGLAPMISTSIAGLETKLLTDPIHLSKSYRGTSATSPACSMP